jgi:hypothetical protein
MQKPSDWGPPKDSAELIGSMAELAGGTTLLAFSRGKDSIATWLALRPHFKRIVPVYYERIPGLEFTQESLAYFEDWFGCKIIRRLHPSFIHQLHHAVFQPYHRAELIASYGFPSKTTYTYDLILEDVRDELGLPDDTPVANGTRVADSLARRLAFKKFGPVNFNRHSWSPIYDWAHADVASEIERAGVKLPVDYELWGHSFDGLDSRFLGPLKERLPRDYATVLKWFPLAELELVRRNLQ